MGSILIDSDKADKSISKTDKKAGGLSTSLGKGIKTAAKFGAALGAGALVAGGAIFALGVKLGNTADELLDLNSITGMSTDNIQKWRKAAEVAGVATDAMTNASTKFTKALDTMSVEGHKGQEALEAIGLSLSDIENMSADERMNVLTEALAGVDDKTERATLGADLFGGTWKEIAPIVDLGTEAMNKAKDSANIISEGDLVKANEFRIKVADMKDQLSFFVTEIAIAVMPKLNTLMDWVSSKMPQIQKISNTVFTKLGDVVKVASDIFTNYLMPVFTDLYNWVNDNMDTIKSVISTAMDGIELAFGLVKDAVEEVVEAFATVSSWAEENKGTLEVFGILIGSIAIAWGLVSGAIAIWNIVGLIGTGITSGLAVATGLLGGAMALVTSPIFIAIAAVAAIIAIGILLYKNWDTIKDKLKQFGSFISTKFTEIKDAIVNKVTELVSVAVTKFNDLKEKIGKKVNEIKDAVVNKVTELANAAVNKFLLMKNQVEAKIIQMKIALLTKFNEIKSSAVTKFNAIKDAILNPINTAKNKVKGAIDTIKGYFTGMKLNLPKIKVPKFSLKNWSINPLNWIKNMPSIGVKWNADGALFKKPTILSTSMGLQGFGEAGAEAALPLTDKVLGTIGQMIASTMDQKNTSGYSTQPIILQTILNGRVIAEEIHSDIGQLMGGRTNLNYAMKGV